MRKLKQLLIMISILFATTKLFATTFPMPPKGEDVVGKLQSAIVHAGDNFAKIARKYDVGYYQLVETNPGVDPNKPEIGTTLIIPSEYVLPQVSKIGIIINLAEMRLYYFPKNRNTVVTYPLGIGRQGWDTPLGIHKIAQKVKDPTWYVPKSIKEWRKEESGVELPNFVPPGPDNPLGNYMMRLSAWTYLIHGTNEPNGVGKRTSSGCLRMFPEDIKSLYHLTPVGTRVNIIDQPFKIGWRNDKLYIEPHLPLQEMQKKLDGNYQFLIKAAMNKAIQGKKGVNVNWNKLTKIAAEEQGFPQEIGYRKLN